MKWVLSGVALMCFGSAILGFELGQPGYQRILWMLGCATIVLGGLIATEVKP